MKKLFIDYSLLFSCVCWVAEKMYAKRKLVTMMEVVRQDLSLTQLPWVLPIMQGLMLGALQYKYVISLNGAFVGPLLGLEAHNQN